MDRQVVGKLSPASPHRMSAGRRKALRESVGSSMCNHLGIVPRAGQTRRTRTVAIRRDRPFRAKTPVRRAGPSITSSAARKWPGRRCRRIEPLARLKSRTPRSVSAPAAPQFDVIYRSACVRRSCWARRRRRLARRVHDGSWAHCRRARAAPVVVERDVVRLQLFRLA